MRTIAFSQQALDEALSVLRNGGVIAHATETCYGLACDVSNIEAVKKLFAIKQRPETQPVSGLFASLEQAKEYAEWNERALKLAEEYLPGPLTVILPLRDDAPKILHPVVRASGPDAPTTKRTIGIRISSHPVASMLVIGFESPLTTTSANIHGQPNPYSAEDIQTQFADAPVKPDLILDSGRLPQVPPSTIVDCTKEELTQRRAGDIKL